MTSKTSSKTVRRTSGPLASSHSRPAPVEEHKAVPYKTRDQDQDQKSESDKSRTVPVERDVDQASVLGEAERPLPPSEKPEAS